MQLGGLKTRYKQSKGDVNNFYMNAIKREVRQAINSLPYATVTRVTESQGTDSVYFKVRYGGLDVIKTVSVRSHTPYFVANGTLLFYTDSVDELWELLNKIKIKLSYDYNSLARQNGLKEFDIKPLKTEYGIKKKRSRGL